MFTTWSAKGIDLDARSPGVIAKKAITAMTPAQGVLCIREFLPNSKMPANC